MSVDPRDEDPTVACPLFLDVTSDGLAAASHVGEPNGATHGRVAAGDTVMDALVAEADRSPLILANEMLKCLSAHDKSAWTLTMVGRTSHVARAAVSPLSKWWEFATKTQLPLAHVDSRVLCWQDCGLVSPDVRRATVVLPRTFQLLRVLYLNDNYICDEGCRTLVRASPQLRHLSLAANQATDRSAHFIVAHLQHLQELNLRGNPIGTACRLWLQSLHVPNVMFVVA